MAEQQNIQIAAFEIADVRGGIFSTIEKARNYKESCVADGHPETFNGYTNPGRSDAVEYLHQTELVQSERERTTNPARLAELDQRQKKLDDGFMNNPTIQKAMQERNCEFAPIPPANERPRIKLVANSTGMGAKKELNVYMPSAPAPAPKVTAAPEKPKSTVPSQPDPIIHTPPKLRVASEPKVLPTEGKFLSSMKKNGAPGNFKVMRTPENGYRIKGFDKQGNPSADKYDVQVKSNGKVEIPRALLQDPKNYPAAAKMAVAAWKSANPSSPGPAVIKGFEKMPGMEAALKTEFQKNGVQARTEKELENPQLLANKQKLTQQNNYNNNNSNSQRAQMKA